MLCIILVSVYLRKKYVSKQDNSKRLHTYLHFFILLCYLTDKDVCLRMQTLRTAFSKLANQPSGSAGNTFTGRQSFIMNHCSFLRNHVRSREGISSYGGPTPDKQRRRVMVSMFVADN